MPTSLQKFHCTALYLVKCSKKLITLTFLKINEQNRHFILTIMSECLIKNKLVKSPCRCTKWSPLAHTQAFSLLRHWSTASSTT